MFNLKKTTGAILAATLSSGTVVAGTMGAICTPGNVTVPCERTAWDIGARALYLEAVPGGQYAYYANNTTVVTNGTSTNYYDVDPRWGWGFMIEGSYHFNMGNDANLNWYHYKKNTTRSFTGTAFNFATPVGGLDTGSASYEPKWDAVNLEFGQHVDFGPFDSIRLHGGVQYARVKTSVGVSASNVGAPASTVYETNSITYNGFGPRFGADMGYDFGNGLSVYGNGATALLIGNGKFSTLNTLTTAGVVTQTNVYGKTDTFVPEFEAKLGAAYTYAMPQGDLKLDAGWMWVQYLSSQPDVLFYGNNASSFALSGPYAGLKWTGNV